MECPGRVRNLCGESSAPGRTVAGLDKASACFYTYLLCTERIPGRFREDKPCAHGP